MVDLEVQLKSYRELRSFKGLWLAFLTATIFLACSTLHYSKRTCIGHSRAETGNDQAARLVDEWRSSLFKKAMIAYHQAERVANSTVEPIGSHRYELFNPFVQCPDGQPPIRLGGSGDGGKLICTGMLQSSECIVYSLGSRNDYSFEEDILSRTPCMVFTFDCTVAGHDVHPRHKFVKKCIGTKEKMQASPSDWTTLSAAMSFLGHKHLDLLKIDIEGSEYDVIGAWSQRDPHLPAQIAMEVHYSAIYYGTKSYMNASDHGNLIWPLHEMRLSDLALFLSHLAGAGYGIVAREDNPAARHCSEFTLVRVGSGKLL
jgi:Methyltransferase domain